MKHSFTLFIVLLFTPLAALHGADRPNVVLFLVDDMGWMDCGVYGSKYYETPNIDRLSRDHAFHQRLRAAALLADAGDRS